MDQMEAAQLDHLCELMDALVPSISQEDVPPALVTLFDYLYENQDVCRALYGKSWESEVYPQRQRGHLPAVPGAAGAGRRHPAAAVSAGVRGGRLFRLHRRLAGEGGTSPRPARWHPSPGRRSGR